MEINQITYNHSRSTFNSGNNYCSFKNYVLLSFLPNKKLVLILAIVIIDVSNVFWPIMNK